MRKVSTLIEGRCLGLSRALVVLGPVAADARESAYAQPPVQIGATQSVITCRP